MKKFVAVLLSLLLVFSLSGCSFGADKTMDEYIEENRKMFDTICESLSEDDCSIEISGKGDSLVIKAVINTEVDESVFDAVAEVLEQGVEESKDTYIEMLDNAREEVPDAESIIIEYYDANDKLLYCKEFQ